MLPPKSETARIAHSRYRTVSRGGAAHPSSGDRNSPDPERIGELRYSSQLMTRSPQTGGQEALSGRIAILPIGLHRFQIASLPGLGFQTRPNRGFLTYLLYCIRRAKHDRHSTRNVRHCCTDTCAVAQKRPTGPRGYQSPQTADALVPLLSWRSAQLAMQQRDTCGTGGTTTSTRVAVAKVSKRERRKD